MHCLHNVTKSGIRECAHECMFEHGCVCACVRVSVSASVRECVCACLRACVCERESRECFVLGRE